MAELPKINMQKDQTQESKIYKQGKPENSGLLSYILKFLS